MPIDRSELQNRFSYHPPRGTQQARYEFLRAKALELATEIVDRVPESREQSLALTHLEQAIFYANAGIARREGDGQAPPSTPA